MYIQPDSTIKIYHNVPLDNTYNHTLYFASLSAQNSYFHGNESILTKTFLINSYQRVEKGKMRVNAKAETLYTSNYLAFQNSSFGQKWFYAFITGVEYVNNEVSEVSFEIDPMQTYLTDISLKECFVEREHSTTDVAGDNIVPENLDIGKYQFGKYNHSGLFNEWGVVVQSPYAMVAEETIEPMFMGTGEYSNVYGSYMFNLFNGDGENTVENQLKRWITAMNSAGFTDSIINVSMYPISFMNMYPAPLTGHAECSKEPVVKSFSVAKPTKNGSYEPRNKKLLTYPYCYLGITDGSGNMGEYKYEFFNADKCYFDVHADPNTITFMCVPTYYNCDESGYPNYGEALTMSNLPLCSYESDTFKIWFAQNKVSMLASSTASTVGNAVLTGLNPIAGVVSQSTLVANSIGTYIHESSLPNYCKGTAGSGIGISTDTQDFNNVDIHLQPQIARIIDSYFDMYGYACKVHKVPNVKARPHWSYVKTKGCVLQGNAPSDDVKKICSIFDNGITFWKNANEVGNYKLDNSI